MNFNKERFANFAKYDLTINKTFFRNMVFVTLAGVIGIAMLGFMMRYNIYRDVLTNTSEWSEPPVPGDFSHYTWNYITACYELGFIDLMMVIFAGCWAHNLRNKQGRITELTLPATNLEKFTWHALLMLVGGFVLCILSLLIADGLNALLTLMMFGAENGIGSISQSIGEVLTFTASADNFFHMPSVSADGDVGMVDVEGRNLLISCSFAIICTFIAEVLIFVYGNALKYKYNIILTYIALQVIGTILSILFFIFTAATMGETVESLVESDLEGEDLVKIFTGCLYAYGVISLGFAALLCWWSYKRYTKAQITSSLNK